MGHKDQPGQADHKAQLDQEVNKGLKDLKDQAGQLELKVLPET
jgi:hypothetical protein